MMMRKVSAVIVVLALFALLVVLLALSMGRRLHNLCGRRRSRAHPARGNQTETETVTAHPDDVFFVRLPTEHHVHSRVYMAIATVPRRENVDYLNRVMASLRHMGFPMDRVHVFFPGKLNEVHERWEEAASSHHNSHFLFYTKDPPVHPATPPPEVMDEEVKIASTDGEGHKRWRQKECYDFVGIMRYMLRLHGQAPDMWLIFNQDDGVWIQEFSSVHLFLGRSPVDVVPLWHLGLVSYAFRSTGLPKLLDYVERYCDWKPVDWTLELYVRKTQNNTEKLGIVEHIGDVSSRAGRYLLGKEQD